VGAAELFTVGRIGRMWWMIMTVDAAVERIAGRAIPEIVVWVAIIAIAMEEETPMTPAVKCSVLISNKNFIRRNY